MTIFHKNNLPLILQSEMAECGLACLAMILAYYNYNLSLSDIRLHFKLTLKGTTLLHLKNIANQLGFNSQVLRIELQQLNQILLPCIIHWDMNHFVVLKKVSKKYFIVHDPANGVKKLSYSDFDRHFTGIVLELITSQKINSNFKNKKNTLAIAILSKYKHQIYKLILVSVLLQLFYVIGIKLTQLCIDNSKLSSSSVSFGIVLLTLVGIKLMEVASLSIRSLMITASGNIINFDIGQTIKKHLLALPVLFYENRHLGDILSRFGAIEKIRTLFTEGLVEGIVDGCICIILLIAMYFCNAKLTVISVLTTLVILMARFFYNKKIKQLHEEALNTKSQEISYFMETIRSIPALKIYEKTEMRLQSWSNKFVNSINSSTRISWYKIYHKTINNLIHNIELIIFITLGCLYLNKKLLTLGVFYAFLSYRQQFIASISNLLEKLQDFKLFSLHLGRLNDILLEPVEIKQKIQACSHGSNFAKKQNLIFENICFSYSPEEKPIIHNFNLLIKPKECIAITGPSGCGKTTLLKILMGFLQPIQGNIYLNNIAIYPNHIQCYRSRIASVLQNDTLFSGTIADNICFFAQDRNIERIYQSAQLAGIIDEINLFPMRFNTLIGDMGSVLSGGQKQRILLARAFYSQPSILFLDEATSHLDAKKENEVNAAIRSLDITVVMIAHRKETILMADRIISLSSE